jgi:protoporphyrinogen IX oxidase
LPVTVVILKFLHAATIALWAAGLLALPFIYRQRPGLQGDDLHRLHAFTRYFYVGFVSPAAFVATGTGTALIFLRETFTPWFSLKLLLVVMMTGIHLLSGLLILRLFEPRGRYSRRRFVTLVSVTLLVVGSILTLVLAKPAIPRLQPLEDFFEPGSLEETVTSIIAWMKR